MRNISFSLTTRQIRERSKDVTRRIGWTFLKAGDRLMACERCMGLRAGEPLVRLGPIEIVSVRREPLRAMIDNTEYGFVECRREGFENDPILQWPSAWVEWFAASNSCEIDTVVTRIEFKYVNH